MRGRGMRVALGAAAMVACAACIPQRDNPNDPSRAPLASLAVFDATAASGACGAASAFAGTAHATVLSVHDDSCIGLSAFGSRTHDGATTGLTYDFARLDASGALAESYGPGTGDSYVLTSANLAGLPVGSAVTFRVQVHDGGSVAAKTAIVLVQDRAPIVRPVGARILPLGGLPWESAGTPFSVAFGSKKKSQDPDGDTSLTYCWSFPASPLFAPGQACTNTLECAATPNAACFTRDVVSGTAGRVVVTKTVTDSLGASTAVTTSVRVGRQTPWVEAPQQIARRFEWRRFALPSQQPQPLRLVRYDDRRFALAYVDSNGTNAVRLASNPELTLDVPQFLPPHTAAGGESGLATDVSRARVWTFTGGQYVPGWLEGFHVNGATYDPPGDYLLQAMLTPSDLPPELIHLVAVDGNGFVWAALRDSTELYRLDPSTLPQTPSSVPTLTPVDARAPVEGIAARPGTTQTWVVRAATDLDPARLEHWEPGASAPVESFDLATTLLPGGVAFVDAERFWISLGPAGLALVRVADLAANASVEDVATTIVEDIPPLVHVVADSQTGDAWGETSDGADSSVVVRAHVDGTSESWLGLSAGLQLVDAEGLVWFTDNFLLTRAPEPTAVEPAGISPAAPVSNSTFDVESGGLWTPTDDSILRVTADGTLADQIFVDPSILGAPRIVSPEPSTGMLWVLADGPGSTPSISYVDPASPDTPQVVVADATGIESPFAAVKTKTGTPFLWTSLPNPVSGVNDLVQLRAGQAPQAVYAPANPNSVVGGAASPASGSICAIENRPPYQSRLFWADAAGAVTPIMTTTTADFLTEGFVTVAISSAPPPDEEWCWSAFSRQDNVPADCPDKQLFDTHLRSFSPDGTPHDDLFIEGRVTSIAPMSSDDLMVTVARCRQNGTIVVPVQDLVRLTRGPTGVFTTETIGDVGKKTRLLWPASSIPLDASGYY